MMRKLIFNDAFGAWLLLTGCLFAGVVLNEMRASPLPLVYSAPEARMSQAVETLGVTAGPVSLGSDVDLAEMQKISSARTTLIIDARPEIFYRLGHIPSAVSLPRDDFEKQYQAKLGILETQRDQDMIVYCAGPDCHDSEMVAEALEKLSYRHVRLFRGGWDDWQGANLTEEKE